MASHRLPGPGGLDRNTKAAVLTAAAAGAAVVMAGAPAGADPGLPQEPSGGVRAQVDRLFEEAEQATERFNEAGEKADRLRSEADRAQDAVARAQDRINTMRGILGTFAGAQYRSGGIDPTVALLLSADPDAYLEQAAALERLTGLQARQLDELREEQRPSSARSAARPASWPNSTPCAPTWPGTSAPSRRSSRPPGGCWAP